MISVNVTRRATKMVSATRGQRTKKLLMGITKGEFDSIYNEPCSLKGDTFNRNKTNFPAFSLLFQHYTYLVNDVVMGSNTGP